MRNSTGTSWEKSNSKAFGAENRTHDAANLVRGSANGTTKTVAHESVAHESVAHESVAHERVSAQLAERSELNVDNWNDNCEAKSEAKVPGLYAVCR